MDGHEGLLQRTRLNVKPTATIATATTPMKQASSCGRSTRRSRTISGAERATTAIMNASSVPISTPFACRASTSGMIPAAFE